MQDGSHNVQAGPNETCSMWHAACRVQHTACPLALSIAMARRATTWTHSTRTLKAIRRSTPRSLPPTMRAHACTQAHAHARTHALARTRARTLTLHTHARTHRRRWRAGMRRRSRSSACTAPTQSAAPPPHGTSAHPMLAVWSFMCIRMLYAAAEAPPPRLHVCTVSHTGWYPGYTAWYHTRDGVPACWSHLQLPAPFRRG